MAECSFSRCVQERRIIKKELQRWTKNMVFVVGLERVAEELMGRRKWKQCQHVVTCRAEALIASSPDETKDWRPQDTCCLCNQGTCLDRAPSPGSELESTSNDSIYRESSPLTRLPSTPSPHALPSVPTMTTFESVKHAAIAALSRSPDMSPTTPSVPSNMFYPPPHGGLFAPWYLAPTLPPHMTVRGGEGPTHHRMDAAPVIVKEAPNAPEMPLDLSAKATDVLPNMSTAIPQSLRVPMVDNKQIYKAKPRMSAVAGRRTYTEEELQAALRDIQSGKLGTRRAAVIYGIPRSTLRNKVYKLAMERERDAQLQLTAPPQQLQQLPGRREPEDKEQLSGAEEEREVEKALRKPLLSMEDLVRFSMLESNGLANADAIRCLLQQGKLDGSFPPFGPHGDVWGGLEHSALGPYISQLLAGAAGNKNNKGDNAGADHGGEFASKFAPPPPLLPELVRRMMAEEKYLMEGHAKRANGATMGGGGRGGGGRSSSAAMHSKDEDTSDAEATSSSCILKIPSFKPSSTKNGSGSLVSEPFPSPSQESSSQPFNGDSRSPPSLIGKGIGVSLRDVIAKSISQKFQQGGAAGEVGPIPLSQKLLMSPEIESPYKRGRYSPPLNHISAHSIMKHNNNNNNNNNSHHMDDRNVQKMSPTGKPSSMMGQSQSNSGSGGKGTRPKRGKYRNYDRDSLVEAVRAVQRGEMSVHRAGSYYGVPHSTLEYKVKERHLMRPRKRDPKPSQQDGDKQLQHRKEDMRLISDARHDKPTGLGPPPLLKSPYPSSPLGPNGLKIPPMFDPAMSPLAYSTPPPFPFWPPNPFHSMPMPDFPHGGRPNAHEHFIASQMMQRLQEESGRATAHTSAAAPVVDPPLRKIAESLYDGTGTNGNFLDGIIRSSLEMGLPGNAAAQTKEGAGAAPAERTPENLSNKALLDQLCRNSRITPLPVHGASSSEEDDDESVKRLSTYGGSGGGGGKDYSERNDEDEEDFSPSSEDSVRDNRSKNADNMDEEDYYVKSPKDNDSSENDDSPSKDSNDESSDNDDPMDDKSACDNKDSLQKTVVEVAAKDEGEEERKVVEAKEDQKTEINSEMDT